MNYDVIILGSGPAGLTAAIYTSRGGLKTLVLTGDQPGGQPTITDLVENFPGFPDGIRGPELMVRVQNQAKKFGAELVMDSAVKIDQADGLEMLFQVKTQLGKKYSANSMIIATGASARWLDVPGAERFKGRGVSVCATCDGPLYRDKKVAVIGGGDTALTEAEFLSKFASRVYLIHRRENLRGQQILQDRILQNPKISVLYNSEVKEFGGDSKLENLKIETQYQVTGSEKQDEVKKYGDEHSSEIIDKNGDRTAWRMDVDGVFLAIGYTPNTDFLKGFIRLDKRGYIKTSQDVFTSVDGVFAGGDCVDYRYRQNIVSCGMGCKAALEAENFLKKISLLNC